MMFPFRQAHGRAGGEAFLPDIVYIAYTQAYGQAALSWVET